MRLLPNSALNIRNPTNLLRTGLLVRSTSTMKVTSFHRGLLLLAGLLLSLHSMVPHVHGSVRNVSGQLTLNNTLSPSQGLQGFLQDFFSETDLGEDHLEHFASDHDVTHGSEFVSLQPPTAFVVATFAPLAACSTIRRQRVFRSWHCPPSSIYPDADAPRGPPANV